MLPKRSVLPQRNRLLRYRSRRVRRRLLCNPPLKETLTQGPGAPQPCFTSESELIAFDGEAAFHS